MVQNNCVEYTGIKVRQMLFQELDEKEKSEGVCCKNM